MTSEAEGGGNIVIERDGYLTREIYDLIAQHTDVEIEVKEIPTAESIRLSRSARVRIRRLKQAGLSEEAEEYRKQEIERRLWSFKGEVSKALEAGDLLNKTAEQLIASEDQVGEMVLAIKAVWLANAAGHITRDKRQELVQGIFDSNLSVNVEGQVVSRWEMERGQIARLMPRD